jgi:hypothetical protein
MKPNKLILTLILLLGITVPSLNVFYAKAETLTVAVSSSQVRLGDFFWLRCQPVIDGIKYVA